MHLLPRYGTPWFAYAYAKPLGALMQENVLKRLYPNEVMEILLHLSMHQRHESSMIWRVLVLSGKLFICR